jgi:hypothetical protein
MAENQLGTPGYVARRWGKQHWAGQSFDLEQNGWRQHNNPTRRESEGSLLSIGYKISNINKDVCNISYVEGMPGRRMIC